MDRRTFLTTPAVAAAATFSSAALAGLADAAVAVSVLLDARRAISVTERQRYIFRVRTLASGVAQVYYESREARGFPMLKQAKAGSVASVRAEDVA